MRAWWDSICTECWDFCTDARHEWRIRPMVETEVIVRDRREYDPVQVAWVEVTVDG